MARHVVAERLRREEPVGFCASQDCVEQLTAQMVFDAARDGDPIAGEVVLQTARQIGRGLSILVDVLNPEMIVIGGIFARAGDLLWPAASEALASEALPRSNSVCRVAPAALGEAVGDYACLSVAAECLGIALGDSEG